MFRFLLKRLALTIPTFLALMFITFVMIRLVPGDPIEVRRGDSIRFVVHKRSRIDCDTTYWDPVITFADGQRFQASSAFSAKKQGEGGWFYEMEAGGSNHFGLPQISWFASDLTLHQQSPGVDQKVQFGHRDALPIVVLSDGADRSGIVLALPPDEPWQFTASFTADGRLHLEVTACTGRTIVIKPGQSIGLATVLAVSYTHLTPPTSSTV